MSARQQRVDQETRREAGGSRVLARLTAGYATAVALLLVLSPVVGDRLPPLVVAAQFRPWLLLLAGPVLLVALAQRRAWTAAVLAAGLTLGLAQYGRPLAETLGLTGELGARAPADFQVRTWNLGVDRADPARLVQRLRERAADVVALQEIGDGQRAAIEAGLADLYPARVFRGEGRSSLAFLSRVPFEEVRFEQPAEGKPWLSVVVDLGGRRVRLIGVHVSAMVALLSRWWGDRAVLEQVLADADGALPTVVLGDFNSTPASGEYALVRGAGWTNAFEAVGRGFGFTWPVSGRWRGVPLPPLVRIDHVWTKGGLEPVSCSVGSEAGSDHLPLDAGLRHVR